MDEQLHALGGGPGLAELVEGFLAAGDAPLSASDKQTARPGEPPTSLSSTAAAIRRSGDDIDKVRSHYGLFRIPFSRELAPSQLLRAWAHQGTVARLRWLAAGGTVKRALCSLSKRDAPTDVTKLLRKACRMDVWIDGIGIEFDTSEPDVAHGFLRCTQRHLDRLGLVHPGVIQTLVDETARRGASDSNGLTMVTVSNATTIFRRVGPCSLVASGTPIHVDERQCLWRTDVRQEDHEGIIASGTVRLEPFGSQATPTDGA